MRLLPTLLAVTATLAAVTAGAASTAVAAPHASVVTTSVTSNHGDGGRFRVALRLPSGWTAHPVRHRPGSPYALVLRSRWVSLRVEPLDGALRDFRDDLPGAARAYAASQEGRPALRATRTSAHAFVVRRGRTAQAAVLRASGPRPLLFVVSGGALESRQDPRAKALETLARNGRIVWAGPHIERLASIREAGSLVAGANLATHTFDTLRSTAVFPAEPHAARPSVVTELVLSTSYVHMTFTQGSSSLEAIARDGGAYVRTGSGCWMRGPADGFDLDRSPGEGAERVPVPGHGIAYQTVERRNGVITLRGVQWSADAVRSRFSVDLDEFSLLPRRLRSGGVTETLEWGAQITVLAAPTDICSARTS